MCTLKDRESYLRIRSFLNGIEDSMMKVHVDEKRIGLTLSPWLSGILRNLSLGSSDSEDTAMPMSQDVGPSRMVSMAAEVSWL